MHVFTHAFRELNIHLGNLIPSVNTSPYREIRGMQLLLAVSPPLIANLAPLYYLHQSWLSNCRPLRRCIVYPDDYTWVVSSIPSACLWVLSLNDCLWVMVSVPGDFSMSRIINSRWLSMSCVTKPRWLSVSHGSIPGGVSVSWSSIPGDRTKSVSRSGRFTIVEYQPAPWSHTGWLSNCHLL